jgi:hypothetical protein
MNLISSNDDNEQQDKSNHCEVCTYLEKKSNQ